MVETQPRIRSLLWECNPKSHSATAGQSCELRLHRNTALHLKQLNLKMESFIHHHETHRGQEGREGAPLVSPPVTATRAVFKSYILTKCNLPL